MRIYRKVLILALFAVAVTTVFSETFLDIQTIEFSSPSVNLDTSGASIWRISSDYPGGTDVTLTPPGQNYAGKLLILKAKLGTNQLRILNNESTALSDNESIVLNGHDSLTLVALSSTNWIQISYSNNMPQ